MILKKLFQKIFRRELKKYPIPKEEVKIWNMWEYKAWGYAISWFNYDAKRITGHLPYDLLGFKMIKVDDELRAKMQSGKIARFRIIEVERCQDPPDMFFADVKYIKYLEE